MAEEIIKIGYSRFKETNTWSAIILPNAADTKRSNEKSVHSFVATLVRVRAEVPWGTWPRTMQSLSASRCPLSAIVARALQSHRNASLLCTTTTDKCSQTRRMWTWVEFTRSVIHPPNLKSCRCSCSRIHGDKKERNKTFRVFISATLTYMNTFSAIQDKSFNPLIIQKSDLIFLLHKAGLDYAQEYKLKLACSASKPNDWVFNKIKASSELKYLQVITVIIKNI